MFSLEEVGKCWLENRLSVQNLTAIFSYDVSRALNTMPMYNLREYCLCLEEKDRKSRSAPNCIVPCCSLGWNSGVSGSCALLGCAPPAVSALGGLWVKRS